MLTKKLVLDRIDLEILRFTWLSPEYRQWFSEHRVEPKLVSLALDAKGTKHEEVWLVTDHSGHDDSPYRIFFHEPMDRFGRECLLDTDIPLLLGVFASLEDTLNEIII